MSFYDYFDSGSTHSFISTRTALQLNLEKDKVWVNYRISLLNRQVRECPILYKHVHIVIDEHEFPRNLIQFDMSKFGIILGMDWLTTYGASIDCKDLKVTLRDQEAQEICFYGRRLRTEHPRISIMKASKSLT